jgi:hypothetical protein
MVSDNEFAIDLWFEGCHFEASILDDTSYFLIDGC